ncbi:MAG: SRPBCC domain-containing protein [Hyphomicrobiales bacterium]
MAPHTTKIERTSDRELVVTRQIVALTALVFKAWTTPEIMRRWWVPKSAPMRLDSCDMDVRTGGTYRLVFTMGEHSMAFFGTYLDVVPNQRIVWSNEESDQGAVSTLTLSEAGGKTQLTLREAYPTAEALALNAEGTEGGMPEQLAQLEELLATMT